jgi:uncharacterized membrane protein YjfL (UPF0719 family)
MDFTQLLEDLVAGLLYGLVGLALLVAGYFVLDMLTPGHLGRQLAQDRNRNAGVVVSSGLLALGIIVTMAIVASEGNLGEGLVRSAGFGIVGIVLLGLAFAVIDLITPGKLGESVMGDEGHEPMAWVTSAALVAVGGIVAAALS